MASSIRLWADMVKLAHSVFALPFALIATFLAGRGLPGRGVPYPGQLVLIVACMVSARSVAMTFNRIADRRFDANNPRTAGRPLPSGRLSLWAAWGMLAGSAIAFAGCCWGFALCYDNRWPIALALPVLVYLCGYSYTKRFTMLSHYYLGTALALSPAAAWLAVHPESMGLSTLLLVGTVCCWVSGFDIIYACQDIDVDRRDRLHSLPSRVGPRVALWIARGSHFLAAVGLLALGFSANLGSLYWAGVGVAVFLLIVENAMVSPGNYRRANVAFFLMNGIVGVILAAATIGEILLTRSGGGP